MKQFDTLKSLFLCGILLLSIHNVNSQNACLKTIFNPDADFTNRMYSESEIKARFNISYRKKGNEPVAPDIQYKDDCGSSLTCSTTGADLRYDMYYPESHNYNGCPLPVVILFHPGGFSDCSSKGTDYYKTYCVEFARRGFVAINLEYRRGVDVDETQSDRKFSTASQLLAIYRAVQDLRGAIRSVIAREYDNSFPDIKVDVKNIFIGGAGTTVLNTAYYTQEMFNELVPGLQASLGKLDEDYYYGSKSIPVDVKAVMNLWGGVFVPFDKSFAKYFYENKKNIAPLISFHGALDGLIPIEEAPVYFLDSPFNYQSYCVKKSFQLVNNNGDDADLLYVGSKRLYEFFKDNLDISTELYVDCKMDHKISRNSGFGTGVTNVDSVQNYIVGRSATFFQSVVNKFAKNLKQSKFIDCENYRKGSSIQDSNNNCKQLDKCENLKETNSKFWEYKAIKEKQIIFTSSFTNKTLSLHMKNVGVANAEIYTHNGQLLQKLTSENSLITIDFNGLKSGVYMIRVVQNGNMQTEKILVQ